MLKRPKISTTLLFLFPIFLALGLFTLLNISCQKTRESAAGSLKLLYTSEVGGRLDPCG